MTSGNEPNGAAPPDDQLAQWRERSAKWVRHCAGMRAAPAEHPNKWAPGRVTCPTCGVLDTLGAGPAKEETTDGR